MALSFSTGVNISHSGGTLLNSSVWSICLWFKVASSTSTKTLLKDQGSQFDRYFLASVRANNDGFFNPSSFTIQYRADNNNTIETTGDFDDDAWHRAFIVRRSPSDHQVFIDGSSVGASSSNWGTNTGESSTVYIGTNDGAGNPNTGNQARLAVWTDTALSSSDAESFLKTGVWSTRPDYWVEGEYADNPLDWSGNNVTLSATTTAPTVNAHPSTIDFNFELPVDNPIGTTEGMLVYDATGGDAHFAASSEHRSSTDAGATWSTGNTIPGSSENDLAQYGGLAAVSGSTADTVHILLPQADPGTSPVETQHRVSTDGGASWSTGVTLQDESSNTALIRRVQIEADSSRVYVVGLNASTGKTWLFRSTDSGQTWNNGVVVPTNRCQALAVDESNGNVYVAGHDTADNGVIKVNRSTDFGQSFGSTITVSSTHVGARPRAAAEDGTVIAAWQNTDSGNDEDIEVAVSTDAGGSYSTVITAMDASDKGPLVTKFDHFDLWGEGGVVHSVATSAKSPNSPSPLWHAWSNDGGKTWQDPELAGTAGEVVWMSRAGSSWLHLTVQNLVTTPLYSRRDLSDIGQTFSMDVSEAIGALDTEAATLQATADLQESVGPTDVFEAAANLTGNLTFATGARDTVEAVATLSAGVTEAVGPSDVDDNVVATLAASISEGIAANETWAADLVAAVAVEEAIGPQDTVSTPGDVTAEVQETAGALDSVVATLQAAGVISEQVGPAEAQQAALSAVAGLQETMGPTDTVTVARTMAAALKEDTGPADTFTATVGAAAQVLETAGPEDTAQATARKTADVLETVGLSDTWQVTANLSATLQEAVGPRDALPENVGAALTAAIKLAAKVAANIDITAKTSADLETEAKVGGDIEVS